jgi:hypothetical protein
MLGEAEFKARPTTPRITSLPVVREGRLPTIPLHPPGEASLRLHSIVVLYSPHMNAKQKPIKKSKATLDSVLSTIERGFAAVADDITDIKSKMATKDDINRLDTKLTKFEEHEIDKRLQLEVRVSAIEKHLGLDKKIAAWPPSTTSRLMALRARWVANSFQK